MRPTNGLTMYAPAFAASSEADFKMAYAAADAAEKEAGSLRNQWLTTEAALAEAKKAAAAGNFDQRTVKSRDAIDYFSQRRLLAFVEGIFGIAIIAAQIAESQSDENTTLPSTGALALDRLINLVDGQRFFAHRPHFCVASAKLERLTGR